MSDNVLQAETVNKTVWQLQGELEDACVRGDLSEVKDLITRGVDPHARTFVAWKGTLLHEACRYGVHITLSIIPLISLCISTETYTL